MKTFAVLLFGLVAIAVPRLLPEETDAQVDEQFVGDELSATGEKVTAEVQDFVVTGEPTLDKLPDYVHSEEGKLSLFADFEHVSKSGVPVYFINRTSELVYLQVQDGDMYLKLQFCDEGHNWRRAEAHFFSDCGLSYGARRVPPGTFLLRFGYTPAKGKSATVRYRLDNQSFELSSNLGTGLVDWNDVRLATRDGLAPSEWPLDVVERVATGQKVLVNEVDHIDLRFKAIRELGGGRFPPERRDKILKEISDAKDRRYSNEADRMIETLKRKNPEG